MRTALIAVLLSLLAGSPLAALAENEEPDNSGINTRDREGSTVTPGDQSNEKSDLRITQEIRKAVVADESLSIKAHNVKIVTIDGVVTLRGPVDNAEERTKILQMARNVPGVVNIHNQLEVDRD